MLLNILSSVFVPMGSMFTDSGFSLANLLLILALRNQVTSQESLNFNRLRTNSVNLVQREERTRAVNFRACLQILAGYSKRLCMRTLPLLPAKTSRLEQGNGRCFRRRGITNLLARCDTCICTSSQLINYVLFPVLSLANSKTFSFCERGEQQRRV